MVLGYHNFQSLMVPQLPQLSESVWNCKNGKLWAWAKITPIAYFHICCVWVDQHPLTSYFWCSSGHQHFVPYLHTPVFMVNWVCVTGPPGFVGIMDGSWSPSWVVPQLHIDVSCVFVTWGDILCMTWVELLRESRQFIDFRGAQKTYIPHIAGWRAWLEDWTHSKLVEKLGLLCGCYVFFFFYGVGAVASGTIIPSEAIVDPTARGFFNGDLGSPCSNLGTFL